MRTPWPSSVRSKLLLVVLGTAMATVVVALGAMVAFDARSYRETWVSDMATQTELVGQALTPALMFGDAKAAQENLGLLRFRPNVLAAAVYVPSGTVFATYSRHGTELRLPADVLDDDGVHVENDEISVFYGIRNGAEPVGKLYLRAHYGGLERAISYTWISLSVAGMAMLVALGLSVWLSRVLTRPMVAVGEVARDVVRRRDYSRRAVKLSNDEVGTLVESFNDMLAEIERQIRGNDVALQTLATEVHERRAAEAKVTELNVELEQRVRERTAQLEASNRELELATQAAERANRAKSEFLSSMSHELRTPLNAVIGFGQLLAADNDSLAPAKRKQFAEYILNSGSHLLSLINEVLDLARIEASNLKLFMEAVALSDVLEECRAMVEPRAQQRSVVLTVSPADGLTVEADRTRLKQVLLNLMSNAVKYNRPGGAVAIEGAGIGDAVRVSVRDTGQGLDADQLAAMYQPFNRLGQEGGTEEGSGIGLVVTKRLVEHMGGTIGVESTPGVGSVFWFELKAASVDSPGHLEGGSLPDGGAGLPETPPKHGATHR